MNKVRNIIEIDEDKCTGCGECVIACAEGALEIVDGKAKLVSDIYCDGLGACLGECPEGALKVIEREAEDFDEEAVEERLEEIKKPAQECAAPSSGHGHETMACGCPSSAAMTREPAPENDTEDKGDVVSQLLHWPIKLQLIRPDAPFLKNSDLLLLADCGAAAFPNLHRRLLKGRAVCMGCPKFDDLDAHIERLTDILKTSKPKSLSVVIMEVPCCKGLMFAAEKAIEASGVDIPLKLIVIGREGELLVEERITPRAA
jgi:ferredoxin